MRFVLACIALSFALPAASQDRRPSHCIAIADAAPGVEYLHPVAYTDKVPDHQVRIGYLDHSMFLIQTAGGLSVVTDYNGFFGTADFVPEVATMNHAHSSHWTHLPDPRIAHVLEGWGDGETPVDHHLDLGELLIRNVATDIRAGDFGGHFEKFGNSIFVFEIEGLCIGHLGHLHHEPDEQQYAALGRVDVVMAAVDGGMTVELPTMLRILKRLKSSVVIPMHWFGEATLQRFVAGMADEFDISREGISELYVGLRTLPDRPTVVILEPRMLMR